MKILIPSFYGNYGGSVLMMIETARILKENNFDVVLRAPLKEADEPNFSLPATLTYFKKFIFMPVFLFYLLHQIPKIHNFDIIYVHDEPSLILYGILGKIFKKKVIWHIHFNEGAGYKKIIRNFLSDYNITVYPSQGEKYTFIPNFVYKQNALNIKEASDSFKIGIVGTISKRKNQSFALSLLTKNPTWQLYLYGDVIDASYHNFLVKKIKQMDLGNRVYFMGFREKTEIYNTIDLLLIPSLYESFGLTFLEALSFGIPVIAHRIDAFQLFSEELSCDCLFSNPEECMDKIKFFRNADLSVFKEKIDLLYGYEKFKKNIIDFFIFIEKNKKSIAG